MISTTKLRPAKRFGPGYFIREQMEIREWVQEDLAEILGISLKHVNKILKDKQPITIEIARLLGEIFDTSAQYWMNIDSSYRLWKQQEVTEKEKDTEIKAEIYGNMPIRDMVKKGWIATFQNPKELIENVKDFWQWNEIDFSRNQKDVELCLQRRSEAFNQFNASYSLTWFQMAKKCSENYKVTDYNHESLTQLYNEINVYTTLDNGINKFIHKLNEVGVVFFVLPHLQKTYLDGAAFILKKKPVIVYTGRYKRVDNFWFTVAHEIAHLLLHLNEENTFVLDNLSDNVKTELEEEANQLAAEKLKHPDIIKYLEPYTGYLTKNKIDECASVCEIHPSIIIGKLAHNDLISYRNLSFFNENVLDQIEGKYLN